jgi:alpha-tubulin suppressor-like RCC1 family protein
VVVVIHSLATKTDGTLWSWGLNSSGQLGQNTTTQFSSPVQIPGTSWSSISAGQFHSLATKTDNTLWSWGGNANGRLGQNDTTNVSSPIQIPGTSWSSISGGGTFSFISIKKLYIFLLVLIGMYSSKLINT